MEREDPWDENDGVELEAEIMNGTDGYVEILPAT